MAPGSSVTWSQPASWPARSGAGAARQAARSRGDQFGQAAGAEAQHAAPAQLLEQGLVFQAAARIGRHLVAARGQPGA